MKPLAIAVMLVALGMAAAAFGAEDLVDAAKQGKAKRRKSTSKVLTNADVRKSRSKLGTSNRPSVAVAVTAGPVEPTTLEKHQAARTADAQVAARRAVIESLVADLEKELAAVEQRYYEENDLDRRDGEIARRFNDVKAKLDSARAILAALAPQAPPSAGAVIESQ